MAGKQGEHHDFRSPGEMHHQASGPVDADGQDTCRALSAVAGLAALPGASRQATRMAVSEGCLRWKCSRCSQYCSQSVPSLNAMDSSSSQCSGLPALIPIEAVRYAIHIVQEQGTLGTIGTELKRPRVRLTRRVEQTWNTGNRPAECS